MRVLVTGAAGFVGRHLADALRAAGHEPLLTDRLADAVAGIRALDITAVNDVGDAVRDLRPEACVHLAGIAFVPDAARDPGALRAINVDGSVHVADALLHHAPRARLLFVSTAQVYGRRRSDEALTETAPLAPASPYAQSKADAESALLARARQTGLDLVIARPGNHTGPGQSAKFVAPAFIRALRDFRDGRKTDVVVGNLESERDFTDVRDVVAAYLRLLENGEPGGIYNISAGLHLSIGELLARLAALRGITPSVRIDPQLYRPTDATPRLDTTRMRRLGWQPGYTLDRLLADLWRDAETTGD